MKILNVLILIVFFSPFHGEAQWSTLYGKIMQAHHCPETQSPLDRVVFSSGAMGTSVSGIGAQAPDAYVSLVTKPAKAVYENFHVARRKIAMWAGAGAIVTGVGATACTLTGIGAPVGGVLYCISGTLGTVSCCCAPDDIANFVADAGIDLWETVTGDDPTPGGGGSPSGPEVPLNPLPPGIPPGAEVKAMGFDEQGNVVVTYQNRDGSMGQTKYSPK